MSITATYLARTPSIDLLTRLILENQNSLRSVNFNLVHLDGTDQLWSALSKCNNISRVGMVDTDNNPEALEPFVATCRKIKELSVVNSWIDITTPFTQLLESLAPFSNITHISYGPYLYYSELSERTVLELIKNSPNLRSITWIGHPEFNSPVAPRNLGLFMNTMTSKSRNHLKFINLSGRLSDNSAALVLKAMEDAEGVKMSYIDFDRRSFKALTTNHANTIVNLDISLCFCTTGVMVQVILSSCPSLENLNADIIGGVDLVRVMPTDDRGSVQIEVNRDWVCLGLQSLGLFFEMSRSINGDDVDEKAKSNSLLQQKLEQMHAFRQLSRLHALVSLDISGGWKETARSESLQLRLGSHDGGLERLETLKGLRSFKAIGPIDVESVAWMKKCWPNCDILLV
ncbi:hypothetical protein BGZ76_006291 [Entomortierella beljakovae]|nr:hypothetical protein BGZ76_006291 [Entomortierella beljakovae]